MESIKLKVLLVDDDKNIRQTLALSLKGLGCDVESAPGVDEAVIALKKSAFDLVLTDFKMEGKSGIDLLKFLRQQTPSPLAVVMTAFASFDNAVTAIKEGAFDYLPKPFSTAQLSHLLSKVKAVVELRHENESLKRRTHRSDFFLGMSSPAIAQIKEYVDKVSGTEATVLITGESGTGKTELARLIHERSARFRGPFMVVNCTSLAENLLESELFGHAKGAFTGAISDHQGKFEAARRGTVFLDEVGDLSAHGQAKLLRVLQERVIERVGENKPIPVDVRVIAATNRNLEEEVGAGRFREDLYYRLNVFECVMAPLRHRKEDLPVLIQRLLQEISAQAGKTDIKSLPEPLMTLLLSYSWPGNIRELRNALERVVVLSEGRVPEIGDLPKNVRTGKILSQEDGASDELKTLESVEKVHIARVLRVVENQEKAAEILGITTVTLWRKRKLYGLP